MHHEVDILKLNKGGGRSEYVKKTDDLRVEKSRAHILFVKDMYREPLV